ncbi:peptidyl-prolyl cis-trans isomerase [Striga asiatica]|uniref:FK506-binding protein n=1 Tax=Striga asiatica TaxID=4170 RepID=A0A5A7PRB6_STRAF|nr:peptidyl-prolyl cis-trans isomerase [Striga asiatica]
MAFWGIEVKPGKPYVLYSDEEKGRLHVSQATLGAGSSTKKSILQCKVGDKKPIYLCSLLPEKLETCALNLEFEEGEEAAFSIIGSHSVHLSGFFYGGDEDQDNLEDDYGSDSYDEGVMVTDSEDGGSSFDSEDEDEDDDFDMYPSSPVPNSGVKIEEIVDDEKLSNDEHGLSKSTKKKKNESRVSSDNENSNRSIVAKNGTDLSIFESEDEDGFPISSHKTRSDASKDRKNLGKTNMETNIEKTQKKSEKVDADLGNKLKRKSDAVDQDEKPASGNVEPVQPADKKKKNKNQKVIDKEENNQVAEMPNPNAIEEAPVAEIGNDVKPAPKKKKEKKNKKQKKQQEIVQTPNAEIKPTDKTGTDLEKQKKEAKSLQVRTFSNGLVVEEIAMGNPAGKRATHGKKVSVRYIGKLKKNDKIFDSNVGKSPFKFRLGIGQVIKGWDVGVNGMRVGDKRRLTIPPAMGYGPKGSPPVIPPNSWLVFDVELVDVN